MSYRNPNIELEAEIMDEFASWILDKSNHIGSLDEAMEYAERWCDELGDNAAQLAIEGESVEIRSADSADGRPHVFNFCDYL